MGDQPRVIPATFHNYRTVLGRKVLQLVFEIPLEQQNEALTLLGYPNAAEPKWYAIARLVTNPTAKPVANENPERSAAQRCAILCTDARFRQYLNRTWGVNIITTEDCDKELKKRLKIGSKCQLNANDPGFDAEAAANFKLLAMTFDSHLLSEKYADVR